MSKINSLVVYDAGALLAAERGDDRIRSFHRRCLLHGGSPCVPAPVLTQAWRGGGRQVGLSRLLKGCTVLPTDEDLARRAGALLGLSGTADAVDAIVVATAVKLEAMVVTSDPQDLYKIGDATSVSLKLIVL